MRLVTSTDGKISVLLADDNAIVRAGVHALLTLAGDVDVVATAQDYDGVVTQATQHRPQVVVTDIRMPPRFGSEGIEAAKEVRKRLPRSARDLPDNVRQRFENAVSAARAAYDHARAAYRRIRDESHDDLQRN
jgi:CheY-like chemotaxis protein